MTNVGIALLLSCGIVAAQSGTAQPKPGPHVNPEALVLADFKQRIDKYMEMHKRLEKEVPPLKKTEDPATIQASEDALAAAIRRDRANAKQGDIFTPQIAERLRSLMYPETTGQKGAETRKTIKEDAPVAVTLKVNAGYPDKAPLPTVPPNLLANLPQLPADLEYRIINRDLILRDVHANLIVDYVPRAIR
jgi:hypothetical protein